MNIINHGLQCRIMISPTQSLDKKTLIKALESKLDEDPNNLSTHIAIADLYTGLKDTVEAFSWLNRAVKRFPKNSEPYIKLGHIYLDQGNLQTALDMFQKATEIEPENYGAYLGIAEIMRNTKKFGEGLDVVLTALKSNPKEIMVLKVALFFLVKLNRFEQAEPIISELMKSTNEEVVNYAKFYQGVIYIKKKMFNKAIGVLENYPSYSKYYPETLHNLAIAYSNAKNYAAAEDRFKRIIDSTDKRFNKIQNDPNFWINLGLFYEKNKKFDLAVNAYEKANNLQNNAWPYLEHMKSLFITKSKITPKDKADSQPKNIEKQIEMQISSSKLSKLKFAVYMGCIIPNRYPMIESATKLFLKSLGIHYDDMKGATCCPAPGVFRSFDIPTWLTIAGRNITIAEQLDEQLLTLCNGCYGTLLEADHVLKHNGNQRERINSHLKKVNREFKGTSEVRHIVDVIYHDIGLDVLKNYIIKKLDLNVAIHYGCHILKPVETKPWGGEFEDPHFFDEIVEVTGCKSIPYKDKMMCCGAGGGVRSAVKEVSLDFTFHKLKMMREAGAQAIITCCPFCHMQLDLGQTEINNIFKAEIEEPFNIPVIYITQLLGYSMGLDVYNIGLLRGNTIAGTPPYTETASIFERFYDSIEI